MKIPRTPPNADGTTTDNEITEYKYENSYRANFATTVIYPDSAGGSDLVTNVYALDGQLTQRTDQRGTILDFTYNNRRQQEKQTASTLGGGTDGSIRQIKREYDSLARPVKITSYSDTAGTTAENQVFYEHGDFTRFGVGKSWQEHGGVKTGTSPYVQYGYDTGATGSLLIRNFRVVNATYPSGRVATLGYGASFSFDQALSRVALLRHTGGGHAIRDLASYAYSGASRLVETRYKTASVTPEVFLGRFDSATPGTYLNLDRFGRAKSQIWKTSSATLDQFDYDHDLGGNRTTRDLPAGLIATNDQLYTYDDLDRLETYQEGTIATGAIASPTKEANWTPDALGNWSTYLEKLTGTTTLSQTRTHNKANEITDFTNSVGTAWTDTTHDAAGNVSLAPSPTAPSNSAKDQTYIWDAWNRLAEVKEGATSLAIFEYDGLHRRIRKSVGSNHTHYYLSEEDQVLEVQTQVGAGAATVRNEFVWHPQYVDALATRLDKTGGGNGVYYHSLHDANFNTTAIVDGTAVVQERYHYTPYGQTTFLDSAFSNPSATSTKNQENLYTGRQLDPETGFYYYRARYYHQTIGRFIGRDPIEYWSGDANLYRYVSGSPQNWLDPLGLSGEWHHLLPAAFEEQFIDAGMSIHDMEFGWLIDANLHRGKGGLHSLGWNKQWAAFFEKYRGSDITRDMILRQLNDMMEQKCFKKVLKRGRKAPIGYKDWKRLEASLKEATFKASQAHKSTKIPVYRTVGRALKVIGFITIAYNVADGGVTYAGDQALRDLMFADEIESCLFPAVESATDMVEDAITNGQGFEETRKNRLRRQGFDPETGMPLDR